MATIHRTGTLDDIIITAQDNAQVKTAHIFNILT